MSQTAALFKIGEVAAQSDLSVKTIRYYEEIGLLTPTVERSPDSNYRLFKPTIFNRLSFIRRSQALGLTLQEIRNILVIHDQGQLPCGEVKLHLEAKVDDITHQIEQLETLRSELQGILSGWQESPSEERIARTICPNLQTP
ncbi:MAG: heavy metal-responsive transcriptional regulator [Synechococcales cyanobacterium T60_A2020_003]|nr:heavy metal-responsive transcriptional regulator [Synechococcales cyanobacterium T60_A2020_003]